MSENIDTIRAQLWEKMRDKPYRDTFVAAHLSTNIVAQIQTLREQRGWTKRKLAQEAGMSPSRITVMEDPSYDKFTLTTLKRLASAFDVALIARFVPFSDLVNWVVTLSPEKLEAAGYEKDTVTSATRSEATETEFPEASIPGASDVLGGRVMGNIIVGRAQSGEEARSQYYWNMSNYGPPRSRPQSPSITHTPITRGITNA